jgi:GNAT superfamily N-acetyltransferase
MYEKMTGSYFLSNDKSKLQVAAIHDYLSRESYWAQNIPLRVVEGMIVGSECFGVYFEGVQVGFARVITDHAIFGYLADVFILKDHRGKGLSKALITYIMNHEPFKKLKWFMLATKDAHGLYKKFGFEGLAEPERYMQLRIFDNYPG